LESSVLEAFADFVGEAGDFGAGDGNGDGAVFDALLELKVFVYAGGRPEVDACDGGVRRADAVDTSKALDEADGIPVDVVIDDGGAVLKVLPLAEAVGGDEDFHRGVEFFGGGRTDVAHPGFPNIEVWPATGFIEILPFLFSEELGVGAKALEDSFEVFVEDGGLIGDASAGTGNAGDACNTAHISLWKPN